MVVYRKCLVAVLLAVSASAYAQLRGHGGPVRAVAISADGREAISGSFDTSAIRWSLVRNVAEQVLRFHDAAVNAVAWLPDRRAVTAGADGKIALWSDGKTAPDRTFEGHSAPVASIAASPDGNMLASASWDRTVRLWPLDGGAPRVLEGHSQNVNGVAFAPDGKSVASAGYDATLRIWPLSGGAANVISLPSPLNAVVIAPDGEIVTAGADGKVYFVASNGKVRGAVAASQTPVIALAISNDGQRIAAAGIRGSVAIIDREKRTVIRTLVGPGLPVWSIAFFPDSRTLLTGGADRTLRRWNAESGEPMDTVIVTGQGDPLAAYNDDPGLRVFRACVACHTLTPDEGNKAGPTLWHVFGRRIATLPGYNFSPALKKLDIVWTPETLGKLFEVGPAHYTPGTKMPEQTIGSADDRRALVDFLQNATTERR